jgi:hypothetical protein
VIATTPDAKPTTLYRLYDAAGVLLYVGVATNPGGRLKDHAKGKPWWPDVADVRVELYGTTKDTAQAERTAVRAENPKHNVVRFKPPKPPQAAQAKTAAGAAQAKTSVSTSRATGPDNASPPLRHWRHRRRARPPRPDGRAMASPRQAASARPTPVRRTGLVRRHDRAMDRPAAEGRLT